jgi:predicted metal-dependent hydrolase
MRPFEPVRCLVPSSVTTGQALDFVEQNRAWIERQADRIGELENRNTTFNEASVFETRFHKLRITRLSNRKLGWRINDREITVNVPPSKDILSESAQEVVRKGIERALRKEAAAVLPYRLATLARQHDLSFSGISLRAQRRRWGSCSPANRINLNVHLMRLPDSLIDYVLLHELAHTVHKNHSKAFWLFLDGLVGGRARSLDRELRQFSPTIY